MNEYLVGLSYADRFNLAASARKDWLESDIVPLTIVDGAYERRA